MANVLVVDDDPAIRRLLQSVMRRVGHSVDEAADGVEALQKLGAERYACVLLDLMMPRVNGWEVLDALEREDRERLRCIIVLSAAVPKKGLPDRQRDLVYAIVGKPFDLDILMTTVRECLAAHARG
jgi:CheY-like chemotaxis protein